VLVGVALAWCGLRPARRALAWVADLLLLWAVPALFISVNYVFGTRAYLGDLDENGFDGQADPDRHPRTRRRGGADGVARAGDCPGRGRHAGSAAETAGPCAGMTRHGGPAGSGQIRACIP
jgi:hypothetical protein